MQFLWFLSTKLGRKYNENISEFETGVKKWDKFISVQQILIEDLPMC